MTTMADVAEQIDANTRIPFTFLTEDPVRKEGFARIAEKLFEQVIQTNQKARTESSQKIYKQRALSDDDALFQFDWMKY